MSHFEQHVRTLMEQVEKTAEADTTVELSRRYAKQNRWLAAWAVVQPSTPPQADRLILENERIRLFVCLMDELVYMVLLDKSSGQTFAEGPYLYRLECRNGHRRITTETLGDPKIQAPCQEEIEIAGQSNGICVSHGFRVKRNSSYIEETITLHNQSKDTLHISKINFGFTCPVLTSEGRLLESVKEQRWVAVPYRRDTYGRNGAYEDYAVTDILKQRGWYRIIPEEGARLPAEDFGAEGWVCTVGKGSLLVAKHAQNQMEFSLLGVESGGQGTFLRFGGCGIWHGDPEGLTEVRPGDEIHFGVTRYELINGGWQEGYYAFRAFMNEQGHGVPPKFNPPVHWNELYDNPLWWGPDSKENRKRYYQLQDMEAEASKAREIGCESLYLDPGWDTSFASCLWDEERLGTAENFVKRLANKYDLKVSLHCPLANWCDASTYPRQADRLDKDGTRLKFQLCSGSWAYLEVKAERLLKLCEAGVVFLMFDGTRYSGPCYDETHGHPIPYTREAHCRAYLELAQRIHQRYPHVLIEMHDMVVGGVILRYCPSYYLHGLEGSYDVNWGFEYMWNPLEDLLSGRAVSLYYYNLAYELPIYLHIDLRTDNAQALQFWWYASTCRHLGVGGKHPDPAVWEAHKAAMSRYLRGKAFYTQGKFYGLAECIHLHVLPEKKALVVNLFNLEEQERCLEGEIDLEQVGIGAVSLQRGIYHRQPSRTRVVFSRRMAPRSAALIELWPY